MIKTASQLLDKYDVIGFEDLKMKGWTKTRIGKSALLIRSMICLRNLVGAIQGLPLLAIHELPLLSEFQGLL